MTTCDDIDIPLFIVLLCNDLHYNVAYIMTKKASEYNHKMPQSQTAVQPMTLWERGTEHKQSQHN